MPDRATGFAPGRVNLIGEHTDYNAGLALPFAIEAGVTVRGTSLPEPRIEAVALDLGQVDEFALDDPSRGDGWSSFVRGVAGELRQAGVVLSGARLEIKGEVPAGAGLSSSAALEGALALTLIALAGAHEPDRMELAKLCSRVENDWVGARTGLLDQIASLFGQPRRALRIDFQSLDVRPVALELGRHRLVTLDSGQKHTLSGSGYNERRDECTRACRKLGIASLREATLAMANSLPEPLNRRARHVVTENERVDATVEALSRRDLSEVGRLLDASHASLRDDYQISTPAVEAAVQRLRDSGAVGARLVGGGFGGSVLGLLAPGARAPTGAIEVSPGAGARLLG